MEEPNREAIAHFLAERHGGPVTDLERLSGGFWSVAYGYRADGRDLVLRIGEHRDWFEIDRDAMRYDAPDLPVPEVLHVGAAFDRAYAISVRHRGRFLEDIAPDDSAVAGATIVRLLTALKNVPPEDASSWRDRLLEGLVDSPDQHVHGWRAKLADDPKLDALFRACDSRIRELVPSLPERRDLVHGDLLHANVLVSEDASRVNAVFSWKCSVRGDFLFDTAWCTFWSPWHPGIAEVDVLHRILAAFADDPAALLDASLRHHTYELHIGTTHLGWNLWTGDDAALHDVAAHLSAVLERGPLTVHLPS